MACLYPRVIAVQILIVRRALPPEYAALMTKKLKVVSQIRVLATSAQQTEIAEEKTSVVC
jgi:hypothetical protein